MSFPTVHIIHDEDRNERYGRLMGDLKIQGITDFRVWPAVRDRVRCKGISLAHKSIIRWAQENHLPECIVFEDDIRFGAPDGFTYYLRNMPKDFDIYSGGCYIPYFDGDRFTGWVGQHLYTVREKFYETFLSVDEHIDIDRALQGKGDYHLCYPYAAIQYNGYSGNSNRVCNYDNLLIGKEIFGMETITSPT